MDSSPLSIENSARQIRDFLNAPHSCVPKDGGRGIVIAGGGGRWKACTYVCISRLRELGCVLPIEVWYVGVEERDEFLFDEMRTQDVTFVDAHEVKRVHAHAHLGELFPKVVDGRADQAAATWGLRPSMN